MERATQASTVSESSNYPLLAMAPFLLSLAIAPLVAGRVGAIPALSLALLVWISVLLRLLIPTAPSLRPTLGGWLAVGYVVIVAATFFVSANQGATVTEAILHASYAAGLWLAADMVEHRQTGWLLGALLAGGFVEGGLALREYLQRYKAGDVNWRTTAGFTHPNFLAGYLGPMVLLTLGVAQRRPAEFKPSTWLLATGLLTAPVVSAFVTTGSRGGILSVGCGAVVLVFLLLLRRRELDREAWVRFGSLCAVAAVVAFALSSPLRGRDTVMEVAGLSKELCPHSGKTSAGESNQFRLLTWRATLNMGKARPVLGWGAGSYEVAFAPHAIAAYTRHAHNTYLQLFADQGLLGLLGWLSLLGLAVGCVVRGVRVPEWYWLPGVGAALVAHAAHSVFDSLSIIPAIPPLIWVLIGIATARRPRAEAEPSPRVDPR
ncbi:MAG: Lipid core-O-antigen ligase, partial [Armatimonadetes bacterium]|nr:Lipid core-O-antigen ligase [Armatimonadota bacterium]